MRLAVATAVALVVTTLSAGCDSAEPTAEEAFLRALEYTSWDTVYDSAAPDRAYAVYTFGTGGVTLRYEVREPPIGAVGVGLVSLGTYRVRPVDGDPAAYVVTYAPERGRALAPDLARFEEGCTTLVLTPVAGGDSVRFRYVRGALGSGPPCPTP